MAGKATTQKSQPKTRERKKAVKLSDLPAAKGGAVKGGRIGEMCATGVHIKNASITH